MDFHSVFRSRSFFFVFRYICVVDNAMGLYNMEYICHFSYNRTSNLRKQNKNNQPTQRALQYFTYPSIYIVFFSRTNKITNKNIMATFSYIWTYFRWVYFRIDITRKWYIFNIVIVNIHLTPEQLLWHIVDRNGVKTPFL